MSDIFSIVSVFLVMLCLYFVCKMDEKLDKIMKKLEELKSK
jgi:hypothetical protein